MTASPRRRTSSPLVWITLALAVLSAALLMLRGRFPSPGEPHTVVLALASPEAWTGIPLDVRRGLLGLLRDQLEAGAGLTVVEEANLSQTPRGRVLRVELSGTRRGDALGLRLAYRVSGRSGEALDLAPAPPAEVFGEALRALALMSHGAEGLPSDGQTFWMLAEATGAREDSDPEGPLALAREVVKREPTCAHAWSTVAALAYWRYTRLGPEATLGDYQQVESAFQQCFALAPHHPRATDDWVGFKTDLGDPPAALEAAFAALARHPRVARLQGALAYPARIAGLLEGADRALRRRDALAGVHRYERDLVETTFLYQHRWEYFENTLGAGGENGGEPSRDFYRGYIRLLRGRRAEALPFFRRAQEPPGRWPQFEALARVYALGLGGNRAAALETLQELWKGRATLRVPDGEFTFKLAEAFGFLGRSEEALDVAERAFGQGFTCEPWFLGSPFLAEARRLPRWDGLRQHLAERQARLALRFPASRFGAAPLQPVD